MYPAAQKQPEWKMVMKNGHGHGHDCLYCKQMCGPQKNKCMIWPLKVISKGNGLFLD